MRAALIIAPVVALLIAGPAAACDFDSMFGYNHYLAGSADQAEADAKREAAIADARAAFIARYGMTEDAGPEPNPTQTASASAEPR
jgi:hypothetical protein